MSAPTVSGKSFAFESAPYAFYFLSSDCDTALDDAGSVCLVVVPLLALIMIKLIEEALEHIHQGK